MSRRTQQCHGGIHTPLMACYHAVHEYPGGLPVVALMMSKNPETLRRKLDSKKDSNFLTLDEAMHILRITGDVRILDAITAEAGAAWFFPDEVPPTPGDLDVLKSSTTLMDRTVKAINELEQALEDGEISDDERARLDKRLLQLTQQIRHFSETARQFESQERS